MRSKNESTYILTTYFSQKHKFTNIIYIQYQKKKKIKNCIPCINKL